MSSIRFFAPSTCHPLALTKSGMASLNKIEMIMVLLFFLAIIANPFFLWFVCDLSLALILSTKPDVDECLDPNACGRGAICENTLGSYTCSCPVGFTGDPRTECLGEFSCITRSWTCLSWEDERMEYKETRIALTRDNKTEHNSPSSQHNFYRLLTFELL